MSVDVDRLVMIQNLTGNIIALCDAPHWDASRKEKIREYALRIQGLAERVEGQVRKQTNES